MSTLEIALSALKERIGGSIQTEGSHSPSKGEINAIRKFTRRDVDLDSVYTFPCLAIDTTPTRNGVIYSAESQKATCKLWIGIPFLFNSNAQGAGIFANGQDHAVQAASQHGRIYKAQLVETGHGNVGTLVWVYTFPDVSPAVREFVNKIDTGILREVSIHVLAKDGVECSICGEDFGADNHEHIPGQKYGRETCYIKTVGQLEPVELSSVACPGSLVAHVMDDSEVSNYKLLPLREALRGSHSPIEANMDEAQPLVEASDAPADGGKKDDDESKSKKNKKEKDDDECDKESKSKKDPEDDPDDKSEEDMDEEDDGKNKTGKKVGKQSFSLFEGSEECPVCHRTGAQSADITEEQRSQVLSEYRVEVEAKILKIMEAAAAEVKEEKTRASEALAANKDATAMLEFFVADTVSIAVDKGLKEPEQRQAYHEELSALGFPAVKALREAYTASPNKKDQDRNELAKWSRDRFSELSLSIPHSPSERARGGFTAPIGPQSKQGT